MPEKSKVGDNVAYTVGNDRLPAKILAINGTTHVMIRLLAGSQAGRELEAPWGVVEPIKAEIQKLEQQIKQLDEQIEDRKSELVEAQVGVREEGQLEDEELISLYGQRKKLGRDLDGLKPAK